MEYNCRFCQESFNTNKELSIHILLFHIGYKYYKCKICSLVTSNHCIQYHRKKCGNEFITLFAGVNRIKIGSRVKVSNYRLISKKGNLKTIKDNEISNNKTSNNAISNNKIKNNKIKNNEKSNNKTSNNVISNKISNNGTSNNEKSISVLKLDSGSSGSDSDSNSSEPNSESNPSEHNSNNSGLEPSSILDSNYEPNQFW